MPTNIDLKPLLDLLSKAGEETSEYKKAKAAGRVALCLFVLGAVTLVASTIANLMGGNSKVGIAAGAVASIAGVIAQAMTSAGYSAARADTKDSVATLAATAMTLSAPVASAVETPNQLTIDVK